MAPASSSGSATPPTHAEWESKSDCPRGWQVLRVLCATILSQRTTYLPRHLWTIYMYWGEHWGAVHGSISSPPKGRVSRGGSHSFDDCWSEVTKFDTGSQCASIELKMLSTGTHNPFNGDEVREGEVQSGHGWVGECIGGWWRSPLQCSNEETATQFGSRAEATSAQFLNDVIGPMFKMKKLQHTATCTSRFVLNCCRRYSI